jgi:hypothetical protein
MRNNGPTPYDILHIAPTATNPRRHGPAPPPFGFQGICFPPSLLIGLVISAPPAGRSPGMPVRQRSYPPTGHMLILQIRR